MVGTFEVDVVDRSEAGIDEDRDDADGVIVRTWVLVAEMMAVNSRQDVLEPVRMKNGGEEVCKIGLVEIVANSVYHPWETLTGFQTYAPFNGS